jgi:hypothetical protein
METTQSSVSAATATIYFVNGEKQRTDVRDLTVRQILEAAGFRPPDQYRLIRDAGHKVYTSVDEVVEIHQEERFTALFEGPTPTS